MDITKYDFTRGSASICSLRLSVYATYLGQDRDAALEAVRAAGFTVYEVSGSWMGTPVRRIIARREHSLIKYFTLTVRDERVETITLHAIMHAYLAGESKELLDPSAATADSPVRLRLLGREDAMHDLRSSVTYAYDAEGLDLSLLSPDPVSGKLVKLTLRFPARQRSRS